MPSLLDAILNPRKFFLGKERRVKTIFSVKDARKTFGLAVSKPDEHLYCYIEGGDATGAYSVHRQGLEGGEDKAEKGYRWSLSGVPVPHGGNGDVRRIEIELPPKWFADQFE